MTTRPRLRLGRTLLPGVLAVGLFGLMALIVLNTGFGEAEGFPEGIAITSELGYAMFGLDPLQSGEGAIPNTESFLAAFLLIAVALDAALDGAIVLAKREENGEPVVALPSRDSDAVSSPAGDDRAAVADGGSGGRGADGSRTEDGNENGGKDEDEGENENGGAA